MAWVFNPFTGKFDKYLGTHASDHTDGTDDIQNATSSQKGLATAAQITKLDGIETGAEVNNISDANATDLTDGGDTTLHDHDGISENTAARHTQGTDTTLGTQSQALNMGTHLINNVTDPSAEQDAATKNYVDTEIAASGYVDRGDATAWDVELGDLTTDGTWRDLDLSSIVPEGARAICFRILINDDATNSRFAIRENGNSNVYNSLYTRTQVANLNNDIDGMISCDSNRVVEYWATNTTWTTISVLVKGWFI